MFTKRPVAFALIYSVIAIIFKLIVLLGGFALTKFGFYFSNIVSVLMMVPFIFLTIYFVKKDNGGFIGGKEGLQSGLKMAVLAIIILSAYHYIEFEWKWHDLSVEYYNSAQFKEFLGKNPTIKVGQYPKIISDGINELSPMKAVTGKLFLLLFFAVSTSFVCAVALRKNRIK